MGGPVTEEMLERPQLALFAEATRLLAGVLGLAGEGVEPAAQIQHRALITLSSSGRYHKCDAQVLQSLWFENPHLLECFSGKEVRTAYDCSPKHLRANFLCSMNRATLIEEIKYGGVRAVWQGVLMQFPEISLWRDLRDQLRARSAEKAGKWDSKISHTPSVWATPWRERLRQLLAANVDQAVPPTSPDIRRLAVSIWQEFVAPLRGSNARELELFTAERGSSWSGAVDLSGAVEEWAYIPLADILLIIGEAMVGMNAEGIFLEAAPSVPSKSKNPDDASSDEDGRKKQKQDKDKDAIDDKKPFDSKSAKMAQLEAQQHEDFDWEKVWRNKSQVAKWKNNQRRSSNWQRGHSPLRGRSPSSSQSRYRDRRRQRSRSRGRRTRRRSRSRSRS